MRSYSLDLRERVAAAVDHHDGSIRRIARIFPVRPSLFVRPLQPPPPARHPPPPGHAPPGAAPRRTAPGSRTRRPGAAGRVGPRAARRDAGATEAAGGLPGEPESLSV